MSGETDIVKQCNHVNHLAHIRTVLQAGIRKKGRGERSLELGTITEKSVDITDPFTKVGEEVPNPDFELRATKTKGSAEVVLQGGPELDLFQVCVFLSICIIN